MDDKRENNSQLPDVGVQLQHLSNFKQSDTIYRSEPPHMNGIHEIARVFGGYIAAQQYLVARLCCKQYTPVSMNIMFYVPGISTIPIDYTSKFQSIDKKELHVEAHQKGRLISCANVRLVATSAKNDVYFKVTWPLKINDIPRPENCAPLKELTNKLHKFNWLRKYGSSHAMATAPLAQSIFEIRPVDPYQYNSLTTDHCSISAWIRLNESFRHIEFEDKMSILILMSDILTGLSAVVAFDQRRVITTNMASIDHIVLFHNYDIDPTDYFFAIEELEQVCGVATFKGAIFTKHGEPVLSYRQQSLFSIDERPKL